MITFTNTRKHSINLYAGWHLFFGQDGRLVWTLPLFSEARVFKMFYSLKFKIFNINTSRHIYWWDSRPSVCVLRALFCEITMKIKKLITFNSINRYGSRTYNTHTHVLYIRDAKTFLYNYKCNKNSMNEWNSTNEQKEKTEVYEFYRYGRDDELPSKKFRPDSRF